MANSYEDLKNLEETIAELSSEVEAKNLQESILNAKMAALQLEIRQLRDARTEVKKKIKTKEYDRASVIRKIELEKEAEAIEKSLNEKRAEAQLLIADAPWLEDAFDWQIDGAIRLPERALLGDKRGLGKTLSALIWRRLRKSKKTLVCLRKEVADDFIKEVNIREPGLFIFPMLGSTSDDRKFAAMLLNHHEEFMVVTNIESWRRNVESTIKDILRIDYDAVILDEAHHIKNAGTGTAQGFFILADNIPNVLELTGTPIKNRPQEMFSLLHSLYPDLFPSEKDFKWDYCSSASQNKWTFSPQGLKNLITKISSFYLARTPEDVGRNVPPPRIIEYKLDLEAHQDQKKAYKVIAERSMAELMSGKVIPIVSQLAIMTRLAQVLSWPAGIEFQVKDPETEEVIEVIKFDIFESVKMDWASELIPELVEEGERVLLFSRFKPAIYELKDRLVKAGLSVAVITGDEDSRNNRDIFNDFDLKTAPAKPKYDVLLATYQTVGESASLNDARHVVLYDRYWNPGNEDQAIGRADRINNTDQATVHIPQVDNSFDMFMAELIDEKRNIVGSFRDAADQQARLAKHLEDTL